MLRSLKPGVSPTLTSETGQCYIPGIVASRAYPRKGHRVVARGILARGVQRFLVVRRRGGHLLLSPVRKDDESLRWVAPDGEGTVWARGWRTEAAAVLHAFVALEQSR